jgi:thioredoxin-like negative regulator of GroEL
VTTTTANEHRLTVRVEGKTYNVDFRQAFRVGYALARTGRYEDAVRLFEAMAHSGTPSRSVTIMLAFCKAGLKDYRGSKDLLSAEFPDNQKAEADQLHTAFVFLSVGMWADGIEELIEVARRHPDLPTVCLLLGEALLARGKQTKAILCWRLATARDRADGAVAMVARHLISAHLKPRPRTRRGS